MEAPSPQQARREPGSRAVHTLWGSRFVTQSFRFHSVFHRTYSKQRLNTCRGGGDDIYLRHDTDLWIEVCTVMRYVPYYYEVRCVMITKLIAEYSVNVWESVEQCTNRSELVYETDWNDCTNSLEYAVTYGCSNYMGRMSVSSAEMQVVISGQEQQSNTYVVFLLIA